MTYAWQVIFLITSDMLFPWLLTSTALRSHLPYSLFLLSYAVFRDGVLFVCMDDFLQLWIGVSGQLCKILSLYLYLFFPVLSILTLWSPVICMLDPSTQPLYLFFTLYFHISLVFLHCALQYSFGLPYSSFHVLFCHLQTVGIFYIVL